MRYVLILLVVALAGCAQKQSTWVRDGGTQPQFIKDRYACLKDARTTVAGTPYQGGAIQGSKSGAGGAASGLSAGAAAARRHQSAQPRHVTDRALYTECMRAKGYTLVTK